MLLRALSLALLVLLTACATPGDDRRMVVGRSTVAEAQSFYGQPTRVWPEADGGKTLEYAQQPYGSHCYMLRFDAEGRLRSRRDGLATAERARIEPGMSVEQVQRLLGRERTRISYSNSGEDVWDWNVEPTFSGTWLRFNVHFKNGVVAATSETVVDPSRMRWAL